MGKASYREIGGYDGHLAHCRPFRGNTMSAELDTDFSEHTIYNVYSYRTLIARFDLTNGMRYIPDTKYSVTTTRQQNLCHAWLGAAFNGIY